MSMSLHHERDNVYRLDMHGLLRKNDLEQCQQALITEMRRVGNVRLIFVLDGFEGWDPNDDWRDMAFYANTAVRSTASPSSETSDGGAKR